jgi:hypothetical protein
MAGKLSEQMRRVPTTFAAAPMQVVALLLRLQSSASRSTAGQRARPGTG